MLLILRPSSSARLCNARCQIIFATTHWMGGLTVIRRLPTWVAASADKSLSGETHTENDRLQFETKDDACDGEEHGREVAQLRSGGECSMTAMGSSLARPALVSDS